MDKIASAVDAAGRYLADHPDDARYTDSVATATVEDGLRVTIRGPAGEELVTDMVSAVGGTGSAPSPGWYLRAAEAACVATLATMRAAQLGLDPGSIEVAVDSESDDRGILGLAEDVPAGPLSTSIRLRFRGSAADRQALQELADWAVAHCPVVDAVLRAVPVLVEVSFAD
jgi:uncharacterized OsmC-like protein